MAVKSLQMMMMKIVRRMTRQYLHERFYTALYGFHPRIGIYGIGITEQTWEFDEILEVRIRTTAPGLLQQRRVSNHFERLRKWEHLTTYEPTTRPSLGSIPWAGKAGRGEGWQNFISNEYYESASWHTFLIITWTALSANCVYVSLPVIALRRPNSRVSVPASAILEVWITGWFVEKSNWP